jgi:hypothetical protein
LDRCSHAKTGAIDELAADFKMPLYFKALRIAAEGMMMV